MKAEQFTKMHASMMEEEFSDLALDKIVNSIAKGMDAEKLSNIKKLKIFAQSLPEEADLDDFLSELQKSRGGFCWRWTGARN